MWVCPCTGEVISVGFSFFFLISFYLSFNNKSRFISVQVWSKCQVRGREIGWYFMMSRRWWEERRCCDVVACVCMCVLPDRQEETKTESVFHLHAANTPSNWANLQCVVAVNMSYGCGDLLLWVQHCAELIRKSQCSIYWANWTTHQQLPRPLKVPQMNHITHMKLVSLI